jgi:hypothetical protein
VTTAHLTYLRHGCACVYCGQRAHTPHDILAWLEVDHFDPRLKGAARNHPDNRITACTICNSIKGKGVFADLEEARLYIRIIREQVHFRGSNTTFISAVRRQSGRDWPEQSER